MNGITDLEKDREKPAYLRVFSALLFKGMRVKCAPFGATTL